MKNRICVAGHLCVDITPAIPAAAAAGRLFAPGHLTRVEGLEMHPGGVVANTGQALQRLGAEAVLMGCLGTDALGNMVEAMLGETGAQLALSRRAGASTSYTVVLAPPGVDRCFLHNPGANDSFTLDDIDFAALAKADHLHFGYPPLMASAWQDGGRMVQQLFQRARALGLSTSLDMAAVDAASAAGAADWTGFLQRVLPYVDYFVPSAEEVAYMADPALWRRWQSAGFGEAVDAIHMENDLPPLAKRLLELGAGAVLLKCGHRGLYLCCSGAGALPGGWQNRQLFQPALPPRRVVSATGAGDVCVAAFLLAALRGLDARQALGLAAGAGACSVEGISALGSLEGWEDLLGRL